MMPCWHSLLESGAELTEAETRDLYTCGCHEDSSDEKEMSKEWDRMKRM